MVSPKNSPAAAGAADPAVMRNEEEKEKVSVEGILKSLEKLLSKESLLEDAFIQQHMNAQMYIPLTVLARHHSLRALGEEADVLSCMKDAAERSDKFSVDEDGSSIRPLLKPRRNTLILHDLPDAFPEEELKALFNSSPESESFCSLKPDVNNTAFATFNTDEAAQSVALWLRGQKLQGGLEGLRVSVKSEHFVRSFFPASPGPGMQAWGTPPQQWGYPGWMQGWPASAQDFADPSMANMGWGDANAWGPDGSYQGKGDAMKGKSPGLGAKGKGKGRKRGALGGSFSQDRQMETAGDVFASQQLQAGMSPEEGLAEPGYTHEYRKYTRQYIIEVCNAMEEIVKPESYEKCEQNEVALFRKEPCKDWAPLPTPMATFASNFFGDDRRGSDAGQEGEGQGKGSSARKASWGPKDKTRTGSSSQGQEHEDQDWQGDGSWWKGSDSKNRRSNSKSWGDSKTWGEGGYGPQWVKKESKADQEAEWEDSAGPRKMSWAEKVKGTEGSQKWVPKKSGEESKAKEKDADTSAPAADSDVATAAPAAPAATAAPAAAKATAAAAAEATSEAAPKAGASWADKMRASVSK